jgi:hypothetical protein
MEWYWWVLIVVVVALFGFIKIKAIGWFFDWRRRRAERLAAQAEELDR